MTINYGALQRIAEENATASFIHILRPELVSSSKTMIPDQNFTEQLRGILKMLVARETRIQEEMWAKVCSAWQDIPQIYGRILLTGCQEELRLLLTANGDA